LDVTNKLVIFHYTAASTTLAMLDAAMQAVCPFYVSTFDSVDTTKVDDAVGDFTGTYTAGGKDLECFPKALKDCVRIIQNCGTNSVKLLYADSGHATAAQFHQVLRAGTAQDDGNGGVVQVIVSARVTAIGGDGNAVRLAITRVEAPEAI